MRNGLSMLALALATLTLTTVVPAGAERKKSQFNACVDSCVDKRTACIDRNYGLNTAECRGIYDTCANGCFSLVR
jgi:hypothetical protein